MDPLTISTIGSAVFKIIDRVIPDREAADRAKLEFAKLEHQGEMAQMSGQMDINRQEAAHRTVFVAGWRPFIGWICGAGLGYQFLAAPLLSWVLILNGMPELPPIDLGPLVTLLSGMLGLAGLRTYEKLAGKSR